MESDLAYVEVAEADCSVDNCPIPKLEVDQKVKSLPKDIIYYRCNKPGHRAVGCSVRKGKFCFRCKKEGFTVRTCPDCSRTKN